AMQVMTNAIEAKFEGGHMGEFVNLINRAIQFRIADFYGAKKHGDEPLPEENTGEDGFVDTIPGENDHEAFTVARDLVLRDIRDLPDAHRLAIIYYLREDSAKEIAEMVNEKLNPEKPMTDSNVHKITSRFRSRMAEALGESK
ncbi:MAG: hypothetical protein WBP55_09960, partial [Solirubrobacterales bacterium]